MNLIYNQCEVSPVTITSEASAIGEGQGDRIFSAMAQGDSLEVEIFGEFTSPNEEEPTFARFLNLIEENDNQILSQLRFSSIGAGRFYARWLCSVLRAGKVGNLICSGRMETALNQPSGFGLVHANNEILTLNTLRELRIGVRAGNEGSWVGDAPEIAIHQLRMTELLAE